MYFLNLEGIYPIIFVVFYIFKFYVNLFGHVLSHTETRNDTFWQTKQTQIVCMRIFEKAEGVFDDD